MGCQGPVKMLEEGVYSATQVGCEIVELAGEERPVLGELL